MRTIPVTFLVLALAVAAYGQNSGDASIVEVTGRAVVTSPPDKAEVMIGVASRAVSAEQAVSANSTQSKAVMEALQREFGGKIEVETQSYSVSPRYSQAPREEPERRIEGYEALAMLRAEVLDLSVLGKVLDVAIQSGANRIYGLQFQTKNAAELELRALREAAADARRQAEVLAAALNARIARIKSVREVDNQPRPFARTFEAAALTDVPIAPGDVQTTAEVVLQVELAPAGR